MKIQENKHRQIRYHVIFWVTYIVLWGARDLIFHPDLLGNIFINFIFALPVVPFIYFHVYYLVPRYLFKKRLLLYSLFFSLGFIIAILARYYTVQYVFLDVFQVPEPAARFSSWDGFVIIFSENMVLVMITLALFLIQKHYVRERYTHELEQKNMESELNMLKAQLQPHFLFNNLNTIYFLMETNPSLAKEVMIQFSEVLTHQLYNAKKDKVPLKEELQSLESFLKIQEVRHTDFLSLEYTFPINTGELQIAPMILLTFIENAFKHGQRQEGYKINISAELQGADLHFRAVNSNGEKPEIKNGGVGLENVQRRLSLIYPNRHCLHIEKTEETYTVDLTMTLDSNGQA